MTQNKHTWEKVVPPKPDPVVMDSIHSQAQVALNKLARARLKVDKEFVKKAKRELGRTLVEADYGALEARVLAASPAILTGILDIHAMVSKGVKRDHLAKFKPPPGAKVRAIAGRQAGKSVSFGQMYGRTRRGELSGKYHWRCRTCGADHWADKTPDSFPLEVDMRKVEGQLHWELPLVSGKFAAIPAMRVGLYLSCDEELVRDVMES